MWRLWLAFDPSPITTAYLVTRARGTRLAGAALSKYQLIGASSRAGAASAATFAGHVPTTMEEVT
jgi:hypothetical protein